MTPRHPGLKFGNRLERCFHHGFGVVQAIGSYDDVQSRGRRPKRGHDRDLNAKLATVRMVREVEPMCNNSHASGQPAKDPAPQHED